MGLLVVGRTMRAVVLKQALNKQPSPLSRVHRQKRFEELRQKRFEVLQTQRCYSTLEWRVCLPLPGAAVQPIMVQPIRVLREQGAAVQRRHQVHAPPAGGVIT